MGDGPKRSPLNKKGPKMGYSVRDSSAYTTTKDDVFFSTNTIPLGWEPAHAQNFSPRRYTVESEEDGRAPVYVPCNIPRWCHGPTADQSREPVSQPQYVMDRYVDLSARENNQEPAFIINSSPHHWLQSQTFQNQSPGHYVDLDIATNRAPTIHNRGQYIQTREVPCQYAELNFDAFRTGLGSRNYQVRPESEQYFNSCGVPQNMSINYGFPTYPSFDSIGHESVGCQADLEDNAEIYVHQDNSDYEQNQTTTFRGLDGPYSEIPVYRRAYDQFRAPVFSPYRVAPDTEAQEQIKQSKEMKSPKKQKNKKHRVSFKVKILTFNSYHANCRFSRLQPDDNFLIFPKK